MMNAKPDAAALAPQGDFIIISEFSELVGPICLQTIPAHGTGDFDIARFVLRIMSVDHQHKAGDSGVFGEDTQVVFFEHTEATWCYVHHLTLLDIHARGYVRPMCITYATRDNHKIMGNFKAILKHFTDISNVLKTGNYELFRDDLKKRMADLAFTKQVVDNLDGPSREAVTAATPGIITRAFDDMRQMRERMHRDAHILDSIGVAIPRDSEHVPDVKLADFASAPQRGANVKPALAKEPKVISGSGGNSAATLDSEGDDVDSDGEKLVFQLPLRESWSPLAARAAAHETQLQHQLESPQSPHRRRIGDDVELDANDGGLRTGGTDHEESDNGDGDGGDGDGLEDTGDHLAEVMVNIVRALGIERDYKPRVIQSLHKTRTMSSSLRTLPQLCGAHYEQAMGKLSRVLWHFSVPTLALSLEQRDATIMASTCSALVMGGVPLMNFNWRPVVEDGQQQQHQPQQGRSHGSGSGTTPRSLPGGLTSGTEETSNEDDYDFRSFAPGSLNNLSSELIDQTMAYAHGVVLASRPAAYNNSRPSSAVGPLSMLGKHLLVVLPEAPTSSAASAESMALGGALPPFDDLDPVKAANFVSDAVARASAPLESVAALLWPRLDAHLYGPSGDIVNMAASMEAAAVAQEDHARVLLIRRFSFSKHAIFSVLKGRPLLVYAQHEEDARPLVAAFASVAASRWGHRAVEHWLPRAPRMSDLSECCVIGLSKQHKIPSIVARYVSVLDADSVTLEAPPYTHGRLLDAICDPVRRWTNPETFAAFLHAELNEIAIVAALFYYMCCVGAPMEPSDEPLVRDGRFTANTSATTFKKSLTSNAAPLVEQSVAAFCREHRLSPCDLQIVQHLSEIVKEQQCQELYGAVDAVSPVIRLDYSKCERFVDNTGGLMGSLTSFVSTPPRGDTSLRKMTGSPRATGATPAGRPPSPMNRSGAGSAPPISGQTKKALFK